MVEMPEVLIVGAVRPGVGPDDVVSDLVDPHPGVIDPRSEDPDPVTQPGHHVGLVERDPQRHLADRALC